MFALPPIFYYPIDMQLRTMGYTYCYEKSYYWVNYSDIAYVRDPALCAEDEKNQGEADKVGGGKRFDLATEKDQ